jgi:hypothetical protein
MQEIWRFQIERLVFGPGSVALWALRKGDED